MIDVRPEGLADICDLVHERDAGGENGVCGVLGQFGAREVHHHDRRARAGEWRIELDHHVAPAFIVDPAPGAPVIYRVQVGGYPDRDKADQAAHRLEKEEHYKPYVRSR